MFRRYTKNLKRKGNDIYSFGLKVAYIKGKELHQLGYCREVSSKHLNYISKELNLKLITE